MFRELWSKKDKKIALCVFLIIGLLLFTYLSGLRVRAELDLETSLNIFDCWRYGFTFKGLKYTVILYLIATVGIGAFIYFRQYENKDKDERGFTFSKDGLYGTAKWMSNRELTKVYNVTGVNGTKTMILGEKDGKVISLRKDTRLNPHIAVFGASGTMKTRAIVRPALFQAIRRGESCVITDPKGELYNDTSQLFRENGYEVKVFNLVSPQNSDGWNCMSDLNGDSLLATTLMDVIIGNTGTGKGDAFWDNGEGNLLKALILYVDKNDTLPPEKKNLGEVYRMVTDADIEKLKVLFESLPDDHPARAPYNLFAQSADNVRQGMVLGLGTRLQVLQNESVKTLISNPDIDLTAPGQRKCAYYVILSAQDSTMRFLSSLFFSLFFIKITRYGDKQPNCKLQVPVNIILDEFCNIGRIGGASDGSDFAKVVSVVRSYGLKIMMIIQSLGQLQNRYPNNLWAELIGNCDTQLMLGCTDDLTAKYVSDRTGTVTIDVDSTKVTKRTFALAQIIPQYQETQGAGKRALLTIDEVLRFPNNELLVFTRGENALRLNKMDYTKHPISKRMKMVDIYQYHRNEAVDVVLDPVEEITEEETVLAPPEDTKERISEWSKKFKDKMEKKKNTKEEEPARHIPLFPEENKNGEPKTETYSGESFGTGMGNPADSADRGTSEKSLSPGDTFVVNGVTYVVLKDGEIKKISSEADESPKTGNPVSEAEEVSFDEDITDIGGGWNTKFSDNDSIVDSAFGVEFLDDGEIAKPSSEPASEPTPVKLSSEPAPEATPAKPVTAKPEERKSIAEDIMKSAFEKPEKIEYTLADQEKAEERSRANKPYKMDTKKF